MAEAESVASGLVAWTDCGPDVPATKVQGVEAIRKELDSGHPLWIDIEDPRPEDFDQIRELFSFHPLAVEDVQHAIQRPKADDYDQFLFLVAFGAEPVSERGFAAHEVDIFLGPGYIVTFHERRAPVIEELKERSQRGRIPLERGADTMLHAILDGLVDSWFPILDRFDQRMEAIEQALVVRADRTVLSEIFAARRSLLELRRILVPHRDLLGHLVGREYPWIGPAVREYLRDVYDHLMRSTETADRYRELLDAGVETYLGLAASSTNQVMRVLAVLATLGLPLTVVTSFYGMNFDSLPGLHHPAGVTMVLVGLVILETILLLVFRKKGWL